MSSKREIELELQLWRERAEGVQTNLNVLNLQAQMLSVRAKECQENIKRLEQDNYDANVNPDIPTAGYTPGDGSVAAGNATAQNAPVVVDAGGGPGEER